MATEGMKLRQDYRNDWYIHAPKGHAIAGPFRGSEHAALDWATRYVSSWYHWTITLEKKETNA